ncbi:MAG: tripartite tricarboxylate transporter TctB family protein [Alphaproteobacteria bacterium]|nr:tripartite tricarboxylate transporter TctB family protein [Alphaproteobacteria bacterium]
MRRKNSIAAIVLIVFAASYGVLTAGLPVRTLPNTPDPSFFPWINMATILILSVWLLVRSLRRPKETALDTDTAERNRIITAMGVFVIYLATMPTLGFILATLPFFAAMMVLFGERRPIYVGTGTIAVTAALYLLFRHGFGVFLPRGLLAGIVV